SILPPSTMTTADGPSSLLMISCSRSTRRGRMPSSSYSGITMEYLTACMHFSGFPATDTDDGQWRNVSYRLQSVTCVTGSNDWCGGPLAKTSRMAWDDSVHLLSTW